MVISLIHLVIYSDVANYANRTTTYLPRLPVVNVDVCRLQMYRQISNVRRTLVDNSIVDHSASPVGAAPTRSSFST